MLAHKAEEEGIAVAELLAGQSGHVNMMLYQELFILLLKLHQLEKLEEQLKRIKNKIIK